jgi:acyl carrier protein
MNNHKKLNNILCEIKEEKDIVFQLNDNFMEILDYDSLDSVELITRLNDEFGITIGDYNTDFDALNSFGSLLNLIESRV